MNKKVIAAFVTALCLAVPAGVSADNCCNENSKEQQLDISKLTESQKADLKAQLEKMVQLKKETVQKMIDNGSITKEQGDKMLQRLDERLKSVQEGNIELRKSKDGLEHKKDNKSLDKNNSKNKKGD